MNQRKILIIDDDSRNIFALKAILMSDGFDCISATGAQEGIAIMNDNNDIGIVLIDMMMPDMDGYEAIPLIREIGAYSTIPIIAVTAQAMPGDKEKCLEAGASGYISKPINFDLLMQVIEEYLPA